MKYILWLLLAGILSGLLGYLFYLDMIDFSGNAVAAAPDFLRLFRSRLNLEWWSLILSTSIAILLGYISIRLAIADFAPNVSVLTDSRGGFVLQNQSKAALKVDNIFQKRNGLTAEELKAFVYGSPNKRMWHDLVWIEESMFALPGQGKRRIFNSETHLAGQEIESSFAWVVQTRINVRSWLGDYQFTMSHLFVSGYDLRWQWALCATSQDERVVRQAQVQEDANYNKTLQFPDAQWELLGSDFKRIGYIRPTLNRIFSLAKG